MLNLRRVAIIVPILLILAFAAVLVAAPPKQVSHAIQPLTLNEPQQTNFQVFNKDATKTAHVLVTFYNPNGSVASTISDDIGPQQSKIFFQRNDANLPDNFVGSAVVSSDVPNIEVITTEMVDPAATTMTSAYNGIQASAASTSVSVPIVMCRQGAFDWNTRLTVQNTSSSTANVKVDYFSESGTKVYTDNISIAPNASKLWDHYDMMGADRLPGPNFMGSATVTSNYPVAVVIDEYSNSQGKLYSYAGIPNSSAAKTVRVPLVAKKFGLDWYTNIMVRNAGSTPADLTVTYKGVYKTSGVDTPIERTIHYNNVVTSKFIYQIQENQLPNTFRGTATIQSTQPIVARVQFTQDGQYPSSGFNAFPAGTEATALNFPSLFKKFGWNDAWNSSISIMNTSSTPANITINYYSGSLSNPVSRSYVVRDTLVIYQILESRLPDQWNGAARIVSDQPIVAVADKNTQPGTYNGDTLTSYEGVQD
jgi:hypothetical protein